MGWSGFSVTWQCRVCVRISWAFSTAGTLIGVSGPLRGHGFHRPRLNSYLLAWGLLCC
uniref:Uncharacterized protein n=1 Tax=Molossus molossus TaxID=27622 RepID=A0A7J8CCD0_MOLMO|nr:hypothetical protein HJG59_019620 [Molossus molossus]